MIKEELVRKFLLKKLGDSESDIFKSKIIYFNEDDKDYIIEFENMRPNCICYFYSKQEFIKESRKEKMKKILC